MVQHNQFPFSICYQICKRAFQTLQSQLCENMSSDDILRVEFQRYDRNKDGFISKDELKDVLGKVQTLTDQDLEDFIQENDIDKDGRINYEGKIILKNYKFIKIKRYSIFRVYEDVF